MRTSAGGSEEEALYRAHFLRSDARRMALVVLLGSLGTLALIPNDVRFAGWSVRLVPLLVARGALLAAGVALVLAMRRSADPRKHDRAAIILLGALVGMNAYVVSTRPPEYIGHGVMTLFEVAVTYLLVIGPLAWRTGAALSLSVVTFWSTLRADVPVAGFTAVAVAHALMHGIGMPAARRIERSRREAFFAQVDERRARAELAAKAADLEAAKERAEALARAKSDFLATMSHEFRTPMNAVLGLSGALSDTELSASQRKLVRTIHQSATSLLVLLNDILDIAKIDAGRLSMEQAPFDVRVVVDSAVDVVRHQAAEKCLTLEVDIAPEVPAGLAGDAARLRQVLVNLLSNAVKFTREGAVSVRGAARSTEPGEHEIVFTVQDTGVGMSADLLGRLFSPFEQEAGDAARGQSGTGLGLAITRRIVDLMGGTIRVSSEPGKGSTFEVTLRARAAVPPPRSPSRSRITPVDPGRTLRTLVVDDNEINQRVAQVLLARLGVRADLASSGQEAIVATARSDYELVFMDLRMPEMDGLEAARRILAAAPPGRKPRIVAMTASAFEEDRLACKEAGMEGFLGKPVQIEELSAVLQEAAAGVEDASRPPAADAAPVPALVSGREVRDVRQVRDVREEDLLSKAALDLLRGLESDDAPGFFADTCRQFLVDSVSRLDAFERAVAEGNADGAERAIHTLKSMSATVGASRLREQCRELEETARRGVLPTDPAVVPRLRVELATVSRALAREAGIDARLAD